MFGFVRTAYLRWKVRGHYRRIRLENRFLVREWARDCCNSAHAMESESDVENFVVARNYVLQSGGRTSFGIAEIMIVIQIIWLIYQLAKQMGWLQNATAHRINEELGE